MAYVLDRPLCTLVQVKDEIGIDLGNIAKDEKFIRLINRASRAVEEWLMTDFAFHDYSATAFYPTRELIMSDHIVIPWPVITATEFLLDDTAIQEEGNWYVETRRSWDASIRGKIRFAGDFELPPGEPLVSVKGTFGYVQTESGAGVPTGIPSLVSHATAIVAARWSGEYRRDIKQADGQVTTIASSSLPEDVQKMLARFKPVIF